MKKILFAFIMLSIIGLSCSKKQDLTQSPSGPTKTVKHTRARMATRLYREYYVDCINVTQNCLPTITIHPKPAMFSDLETAISHGDTYVATFFSDDENQLYFDEFFGTSNIIDLANGDVTLNYVNNSQEGATYYLLGTRYNLDNDNPKNVMPLAY